MPSAKASSTDVPKEDSILPHITAVTRYLARCRIAGDTRAVDLVLRDLLSEHDAATLQSAVMTLFGEGGSPELGGS